MKSHSNFDAKARTHDPKTSWEAAESIDTNRLEKIVLSSIKAHGKAGATHDEVWNHLMKSHKNFTFREGSITPRYATLERKGLINRNGDTRKGRAGRSQLVMYSTK
jgi:hypothetical protein|tara:strand:+ start:226 stop:543 length:318 start_codon:yes stop_codon:yes gene_type:complete